MPENKKCTKCGVAKPLTEYYNRKIAKDGKNSHCKECDHADIFAWRKANPKTTSDMQRRSRLKGTYGITEEQYNALLETQNYSCAICNRHEDSFKIRLAVDHNHSTGRIRGLLCNYCNHRVVGRHTDGDLLRKMADYIEGGTDWYVPKNVKGRRKKRRTRAEYLADMAAQRERRKTARKAKSSG